MRSSMFVLLAACLAALPAAAIMTRADRDDAEYVELASRYDSAIALGGAAGEGVLIAPRWVLTAAQRARALEGMKPLPRIRVAQTDFEIAAIFTHPAWSGRGNDVGLIMLRKPVTGVIPTRLYRDSDELGKAVVIVGHGASGAIGTTAVVRDGRKRAAINTIGRVQPRTLGLKIKSGDDASDLQGAAAADETGAPAFIETPEGLFVAGVAIATEGEWELYTRMSAYVTWIESVMLEAAKDEAAAFMDPDRR
jgi:Trypsin